MSHFRNQILLGDCLQTMPTLPAGIVQCVVTSPPYFALRSYLPAGHPDKSKEIGSEVSPDAFIATMVAVFREVRRVMRSDGVCFINLGDSMSSAGGHGPGQLMNIPHRVAEALRQDGWNWRQTIVWAKKSPMPESVRGWRWVWCKVKTANGACARMGERTGSGFDYRKTKLATFTPCPGCPKCIPNDGWVLQQGKGRCTTAHEYIFVMTKSSRYFWDGEASKEAVSDPTRSGSENRAKRWGNNHTTIRSEGTGDIERQSGIPWPACETRNPRSVFLLSSEPTKEKHFAAFPSELVRRCLVAGCSAGGCCAACGMPFAPMVESDRVATRPGDNHKATLYDKSEANTDAQRHVATTRTLGYRQCCQCDPMPAGRQIVFDPFMGTGTVAQTARQLGHDYLGCELNPAYIEISDRRIQEPPRWWLRQQKPAKKAKPVLNVNQRSLFV